MTNVVRNFELEVSKLKAAGHKTQSVFGRNDALSTTEQPLVVNGVINFATAAESLEVLSDNAADAAAGVGARKLILCGLDGVTLAEKTEEITMDGVTPVAVPGTWFRIDRARVSESGTYTTTGLDGGNIGTLTVRIAGAGAVKLTVGPQTAKDQYGAFSVPAGKIMIVTFVQFTIDTGKSATFRAYRRAIIDDAAAPGIQPRELVFDLVGIERAAQLRFGALEAIDEKTDVWVTGQMGIGAGDGSVFFQYFLIDKSLTGVP